MKFRMNKFLAVLLAVSVLLCCSMGVAAAEKDQYVQQGYDRAKSYYQNYTDEMLLEGYWGVFGAYATLGDRIQSSQYVYDMTNDNSDHNGAKVLAILMMGDDPYHYNGQNYVAKAAAKGLSGGYAVPVFNFLAMQAAAVEMDAATEKGYIDYCCEQMTELSLGPDVGGWAMAALYNYYDHPEYKAQIEAAIKTYTEAVGQDMAGNSMGSAGLSVGCVVTGLTALCAAGKEGYDPTTDSPWVENEPLKRIYTTLVNGEAYVSAFYNNQYYMELSDLYNVLYKGGEPVWITCAVDAADFSALLTKAEQLLNNKASYPTFNIERVETALAAAEKVTDAELNAEYPGWGEIYFDLYSAVNNCQGKGDPSAFNDIDSSAWYASHVTSVVEERLMNGTSDTTFVPEGTLTRAMVVQILYNMEGRPNYDAANDPFTDIQAADWYAPAVLWAYQNGVTTGISATTFDPNASVTREQMATFIYRYITEYKKETLSSGNSVKFSDDAAISSWATASVYAMAGEGIINGMGDGTFAPKSTATRAQMAKIIDAAFLK